MTKLRFAFLTSEFVSEDLSRLGGGLASYLDRMTQALVARGVEVEVFVGTKSSEPGVIEYGGVRVHRVRPYHRVYSRVGRLRPRACWAPVAAQQRCLALSASLKNAFLARHRERPFQAVQSASYLATGLFIPKLAGCRHLVRMSSDHEAWLRAEGDFGSMATRLTAWLERSAVRRADVCYAPSAYVARLLNDRWHCDVNVVRPPMMVRQPAIADVPLPDVPGRYLIHFGQFRVRKGTHAIAQALPLVWDQVPDFQMVWAGVPDFTPTLQQLMNSWGDRASQVRVVGRVDHKVLNRLVKQSVAAVLPSTVDNLPNTVIETLSLGKPVIGFNGGSVDELVDDGINGILVKENCVEALANAMVAAWREQCSCIRDNVPPSSLFAEMEPDTAVGELLKLAGLSPAECA